MFIIVLEDTPSRIEWLKRTVEPFGIMVLHSPLVRVFLELVERHEPIVGVVLDHDLGGYSMPVSLQDPEGLDGVDAVEQVTKVINTRFLVWSSNHEEAPRMEAILRQRGATLVDRASWGANRPGVHETITRWIEATRDA